MAEITWQNVNAPSNADVFRGMALAAAGLDTATNTFKAAGDTFAKANQNAMDQSDAAKLLQAKAALAQAKTPGEYDAVIAAQTPTLMTYNNPDTASKFITDSSGTFSNQMANRLAGGTSGTSAQVGEIQAPEKIDRATTEADAYTGAAPLLHEAALKKTLAGAQFGLGKANTELSLVPSAISANDVDAVNKVDQALYGGLLTQNSLFPKYTSDLLNQTTQQAKDLVAAKALYGQIPTIETTTQRDAEGSVHKAETASQVNALANTDEERAHAIDAKKGGMALQRTLAANEAKTQEVNSQFELELSKDKLPQEARKQDAVFSTNIGATSSKIQELQNTRASVAGVQTLLKDTNLSKTEKESAEEAVAKALTTLRQDPTIGEDINTLSQNTLNDLARSIASDGGFWFVPEDLQVQMEGLITKELNTDHHREERIQYKTERSRLDNEYADLNKQRMLFRQNSLHFQQSDKQLADEAAKIEKDKIGKTASDTVRRDELQQSQDEAEAVQKQNALEEAYLLEQASKESPKPVPTKKVSFGGFMKDIPMSAEEIKQTETKAAYKAMMDAARKR
jgi:hypothetical protein